MSRGRGLARFGVAALAVAAFLLVFGFIFTRIYVAYAGGLISRRELDTRLRQVQFAYNLQTQGTSGEDPGYARREQQAILEQLVVERLLISEARKQNLTVTAEERQTHVSEVVTFVEQEFYQSSRAALEQALSEQKLTMAQFEEYLAETLVVFKLRDQMAAKVVVSDAELRAYYDAHRQDFNIPEMIRVRHILVAEQSQAEELLQKIHAGQDFNELARENSKDTRSQAQGGDLNWRARGEFVPAFDEEAWRLTNVGEVSNIVETDFGFHIIKLEGKLAPRERSFTEVQELVKDHVYEEREAVLWENYLALIRQSRRVIMFIW